MIGLGLAYLEAMSGSFPVESLVVSESAAVISAGDVACVRAEGFAEGCSLRVRVLNDDDGLAFLLEGDKQIHRIAAEDRKDVLERELCRADGSSVMLPVTSWPEFGPDAQPICPTGS